MKLPTLSELEKEQIYFQSKKGIRDIIKAGAPITLWNGGSGTVRISDWTNPEEPKFEIVVLHDSEVSFYAGGLTITGYTPTGGNDFKKLSIDLVSYDPLFIN